VNRKEVARATAALENARKELRVVLFMVRDSMERLVDELDRRGAQAKTIHLAALDVHSDAGQVAYATALVAEMVEWRSRAKAGKRRRMALKGWPTIAEALKKSKPRRRLLAEATVRYEDENP
jgi:hypothetical protein